MPQLTYLSRVTGIDKWLHHQHSAASVFYLLMGGIMVCLILVFFYFSLFKYIFLIIGSPLFAYLSEKTEAIIEGKDVPFNFKQLLKDMNRGIRLRYAIRSGKQYIRFLFLSFPFFPFDWMDHSIDFYVC